MADAVAKPVAETPKEEKVTTAVPEAKIPEVNVPAETSKEKIDELKAPEENKPVEESPKETPAKIEEPKKVPVVESPKEAPKVEAESPKEKTPAPKTPEIEVPAKTPEPEKSEKEAEKTPEAEAPKVETPVKEPEIEKPKEEGKIPETKAPEIEAPAKSPAVETPKEEVSKAPEAEAPKGKGPDVKASLAETLVTAVENVVVEAGSAAVKEFSKKTADDLNSIEKNLSQEVIEETKDGISLAEIGETIVDVVETIAEEIVEGAEIVIKDVKAHPELLAEGAIAVGIGIASIVQPELIVGSVAMFGKMAADRAKVTANEIAVEASTHIVNELSKDLTEELAGHKLEATTTKTDTVKEEKTVDEATGTIVNKETTSSTKETTVVIDGKEVTPEPAISSDAPKEEPKVEKPVESSDAVKNEVEEEEKKEDDDAKGPTVTVSSTTKTVSVKIDEDGTITIGTGVSDKVKGNKKKAKKEGAPKETEIVEKAGASEKTSEKVEVPKEAKATITPDKTSTEEVDVPKVIKDVEKLAAIEVKSEVEVAKHLEKEIDKVIEQVSVPHEPAEKPSALSVDLHHESLSQIHQKLDSLIASDANAKGTVVAPTPETVTPDALEKIHLKLDALILSNSEAMKSAASKAEKDSEMVTQSDLEKLHAKLDKMQEALEIKPKSDEGFVHVHEKMDTIHEAILANAKSAPVEVAPEPVSKEIEDASAAKLDELHQKFETMQAAINALTEALTQKLAAESTTTPPAEPSAVLTPEPSLAAQEPTKPVSESSEVIATPPVNTEVLKDIPEAASTPKVDETENTTSEASKDNVAPSGEVKTADENPAAPTTETKKPAVDPSKKHVKRSSFFGGFFG